MCRTPILKLGRHKLTPLVRYHLPRRSQQRHPRGHQEADHGGSTLIRKEDRLPKLRNRPLGAAHSVLGHQQIHMGLLADRARCRKSCHSACSRRAPLSTNIALQLPSGLNSSRRSARKQERTGQPLGWLVAGRLVNSLHRRLNGWGDLALESPQRVPRRSRGGPRSQSPWSPSSTARASW